MLVNQDSKKVDAASPAVDTVHSVTQQYTKHMQPEDAFSRAPSAAAASAPLGALVQPGRSLARRVESLPNLPESAQTRWRAAAERDPTRLLEARNGLAAALSARVMTFAEIAHFVEAAYPVEIGYLMGEAVKVSPDRVGSFEASAGARQHDDPEVVKVVARIAFLNYAMHAAHERIASDEVQPKYPLSRETLAQLADALSGFRLDGTDLTDLKSFINALVITSLGKNDALVRPRLRELGGISESPEERLGIVLNLGNDIVPCLADTGQGVLDTLKLGAERSFNVAHIVQGEGPAACVHDLDMSSAQRSWYAVHGLVCAAGASAMSAGGFFTPTETIVGRYIDVLKFFGQDISALEAYMGFMRAQVLKLGLPNAPESLALVRLLLHARTLDDADIALLYNAWADLKPSLKLELQEGLLATGIPQAALRRAIPAPWADNIDDFGANAMCTMIQYAPALFNNASYADAKRLESSKDGYTRGLTLLAALYREGNQLLRKSRLKGAGILRADAQQLAETVRHDHTVLGARLFLVERQSRDSGVRLDAIGYARSADLARLESLVGAGSVECRLMQILGENILTDSVRISDGVAQNLRPSEIFRARRIRVPTTQAGAPTAEIDAAFRVTPATRAALLPLVESFAETAEALLGSNKRVYGALSGAVQTLLDNFQEALHNASQPLQLDRAERIKAFIGVLDEVAAEAPRDAPKDHYGLRRMALVAGNGAIKSWQAFTYSKRFVTTTGVDWDFIANHRNWLPERLKVQGHLIAHAFVSILRTSSQLKVRRPQAPDEKAPDIVGYMITGGFGSGKTTLLHQTFGFDVHRVGSDALKEHLTASIDGFLPFDLVHLECSALSYDVVHEVMNDLRGVYLFDTSLARAEDARRPIAAMKGQGMLHIMGLHVPLHISLLRVLGRRVVDRNDPRIPFRDVVTGWQKTVENRREVCEVIKANQKNADYELYISNNTGADYQRVATVKKGEESVVDMQRWMGAVNPLSEDAVAALGARTLRDLLADRGHVAEDTAVRLDLKFAGRDVRWNELNETEQALLRQRDAAGLWERSGRVDFRDLPLSVALDVNARCTVPWAGEMDSENVAL